MAKLSADDLARGRSSRLCSQVICLGPLVSINQHQRFPYVECYSPELRISRAENVRAAN